MKEHDKDRAQIHCPKCGWCPTAEDRWVCTDACGTAWNTFWTRGVCPGCSVQWPQTQCLECAQFSPHEAWYHYPPDAERDEEAEERQQSEASSKSVSVGQ